MSPKHPIYPALKSVTVTMPGENVQEKVQQPTNCACIKTEDINQLLQGKMYELFDEQFEILKDKMMTVVASKISSLIEDNNNLRLEIQQLRDSSAHGDTQKKELSVVHQLLTTFNSKLSDVEDKQTDAIKEINCEVQSVKDNVKTMLEEIPQVTSIENRFSSIEETISNFVESKESSSKQVDINCEAIHALEVRILSMEESQLDNSIISNLQDTTIAAVANELEERNKRERSIVLHNVPESQDSIGDVEAVKQILQEVTSKEIEFELMNNKPRIYRLGRHLALSKNKPRSIKVHLKSADDCDEILRNLRKLSQSAQHPCVVIQRDMTPMQRNHIKLLVMEKKRRNNQAIMNNEEPNWTVSSGFLHRRGH